MASRDFTQFFRPKPKPSEALESVVSDDVISLTTAGREEVQNQLKEDEDKKAGRSFYCKYTKTDLAEIGRYATKHALLMQFKNLS